MSGAHFWVMAGCCTCLFSDVIFFSSRTRIRHAGFSSAGHGTLHRHYPSFGLYDHGYITTLVCRYGGFFPFLFFTFLQLEGMMLSFMHQSLVVLILYTLTSVCIFSILFSIHFLRRWQGEFVYQSKALSIGDHFLHSHDLNVGFSGDILRRN